MLQNPIERIRATVVKLHLRQACLLACFAIVAGFCFATPSTLSAARPPHAPREVGMRLGLQDTGETVALPVGQQLIISLPLQPYDDNYWYVSRNSGGAIKLIAGPDTRRGPNWTPLKYSTQIFYFQRVSPGTADLVLEQSYFSKPMILRIVDR
jgi:hypothetical protein